MKKLIIIAVLLIAGFIFVSQKGAEKTTSETEKRDKNILKQEQKRMEDMKNMDQVMQKNLDDRIKSVDDADSE